MHSSRKQFSTTQTTAKQDSYPCTSTTVALCLVVHIVAYTWTRLKRPGWESQQPIRGFRLVNYQSTWPEKRRELVLSILAIFGLLGLGTCRL